MILWVYFETNVKNYVYLKNLIKSGLIQKEKKLKKFKLYKILL